MLGVRKALKNLLLSLLLFGGMFFIFTPAVSHAQDAQLEDVGTAAELSDEPIATIVGRIIGIFLSVLGIIFLLLVLYAGFLWMTAAGNADQVDKAKKLLIQATIGLIIILLSFAITNFVIRALTGEGVFGNGSSNGSDFSGRNGFVSVEPRSGSLGQGGINDHYPARGETDVPRNANIFITFEEPVDQTDFSAETVLIYVTADGQTAAFKEGDLSFGFSEDGETAIVDVPVLGSATQDVQYTVFLDDAIDAKDGSDLVNSGGYEWSFTVGTVLDLDPPTVRKVTPRAGGSYDRNIAVQITFDEAVDPSSASGTYGNGGTFDAIQVVDENGAIVEGTYELSNEYKTVTFTSSSTCGTNSCGDVMTCLAGGRSFTVTVFAATPGGSPPQVDFYPYDGIVDLSQNALDGNNDGIAGDDYSWSFSTTNSINLAGPTITSVTPEVLGENVDLDQKVLITFDQPLMRSTLTSETITLESNPNHELSYRLTSEETDAGLTIVTIHHGVFLESSEQQSYQYAVSVSDEVKNEYQNCFYPAEGPAQNTASCGTTASAPYCCNGIPSSSACSLF
jgi:hypothetical protein